MTMNKKRLFSLISALGVISVLLVLGSIAVKAQNQQLTPPDKSNTVTITPEIIGQIGDGCEVVLQSNYAYIAQGYNGLHIFDISNPADPKEVGFYDTPGYACGLAVEGNYAYVADGESGLLVIDISNPSSPIEVGFCDIPSSAFSIAVAGNYAYIIDGVSGLHIIDISNPAAPSGIGVYDMPGYPSSLAVNGMYVYVANGVDGLLIIDVSNPAAPTEVGTYDLPYYAKSVIVRGNYAFITDCIDYNEGGLHIIDISNPSAPKEDGYIFIIGANDVAVEGNYAYVTYTHRIYCPPPGHCWISGLVIIDISNPVVPMYVGGLVPIAPIGSVAVAGNYVFLGSILRLLTDYVTTSIPITGNSLASTDGNTNLIFPSGAFTQTVNVNYKQLLYDENVGELVGIGHTFDISAVISDTGEVANLAPGQTFTMTIQYSDDEKGAVIEDTLALYSWDGTNWVKEATSSLDPVNNLITATSSHLSLWAVLGETNRFYFPVIGKVGYILLHFFGAHFFGMALPVKKNKALDPIGISFFSAIRIMFHAYHFANLIK
jgi:hypothetical protein